MNQITLLLLGHISFPPAIGREGILLLSGVGYGLNVLFSGVGNVLKLVTPYCRVANVLGGQTIPAPGTRPVP
jgi:hypothetical protein